MVHHFDHRWASYQVKGRQGGCGTDVSLQDKENPDFTVLPRYWVAAREVHLRTAKLPKGLLAALRDRNNEDLIVLAVCHLLFINRLRQEPEGSADAPQSTKSSQTGSSSSSNTPSPGPSRPPRWACGGNNPPSIQPLGPSYLPAEPLDKIKTGPRVKHGLVCR